MNQYKLNHLAGDKAKSYNETYSSGYFYHQWNGIEKPYLMKLLSEFEKNDKNKYLDLACGTGRIISLAENYFVESVGIDISGEMLEIAKNKCTKSTFYKYDLENVGNVGVFDVITMFRFFLNAEIELRNIALKKVNQLLAPEGRFVTNIHVNSRSIRGIFYRARNCIKRRNIANTEDLCNFQKLLNRHGFTINSVFHYGYLPRIWRLTDYISEQKLVAFEEFCNKKKWISDSLCESFIVVCEKNKIK